MEDIKKWSREWTNSRKCLNNEDVPLNIGWNDSSSTKTTKSYIKLTNNHTIQTGGCNINNYGTCNDPGRRMNNSDDDSAKGKEAYTVEVNNAKNEEVSTKNGIYFAALD